MDNEMFQKQMDVIMNAASELPAGPKNNLQERVKEMKERRQKTKDNAARLKDSIDYLRLTVKYLVFDLEATRRENQLLRDMLGRGQ